MFLIKLAIKRLSWYCTKHECGACRWHDDKEGCFFIACPPCDWEEMLKERGV